MREYAKISPMFWTGETGRILRKAGRDAQVVALYLVTGPSANMIGLYELPIPLLAHHIGMTLEGASKALARASEGGFCRYDAETETVWVPEMARFQLGDQISAKDNRHKAIIREWQLFKKSKHYADFHVKYRESFDLPDLSPFEAPSKPLRSQEQEQEQEQEKEKIHSAETAADAEPKPKRRRAPSSEPKPRPPWPTYDAIAEVTGCSGSHVAKVAREIEAEPNPLTPEEIREFGRRFAALCPHVLIDGIPRLPNVGELGKYASRVRSPPPAAIVPHANGKPHALSFEVQNRLIADQARRRTTEGYDDHGRPLAAADSAEPLELPEHHE